MPDRTSMGLGMAALGRPSYINLSRDSTFGPSSSRTIATMRTQAEVVLDALFATSPLPVHIDCARSYGLSEAFVGSYMRLRSIPPERVHVSSKWGYTYVAGFQSDAAVHEVKDHSLAKFLEQVEETQREVGDFVRLYQVHSATFESGILSDAGVHEALAECRRTRGWRIGLSVSGPSQGAVIRAAMKISVGGERLFDAVQCTFNVLEQGAGPALAEAHAAGMSILVKEGMANGRVMECVALAEYARKLEVGVDQLALACVLAQPFLPQVLSGAVTGEQLESNFRARQVKVIVEEKGLLDEIMQACVVDSCKYWEERAALRWN